MANYLQLSTAALPAGSLDSYIQRVNAVPLLSKEQEYELAQRLSQENDLAAAQELILSHMRYVVRIAKGYLNYGLPLADLIQEGTIGLMKAVKRFDVSFDVRLASFAVHWIKAEIHDYVLKNWRIVKVATTKAQRKLFFNLRKAKKRLGWMKDCEVKALAQDLKVSTKEVLEMEKRLNAVDASFAVDVDEEQDKHSYLPAPEQYLEHNSVGPEQFLLEQDSNKQALAKFGQAWQNLSPREQDILSSRYLTEKKVKLEILAEKYGISIERVRQLEKATLEKLKAELINFQ